MSCCLIRQDLLKWNGWGYKDSEFVYDATEKVIRFTGSRYDISGKRLPRMCEWASSTLGINFDKQIDPQV